MEEASAMKPGRAEIVGVNSDYQAVLPLDEFFASKPKPMVVPCDPVWWAFGLFAALLVVFPAVLIARDRWHVRATGPIRL